MRSALIILCFSLVLVSCGSSKKAVVPGAPTVHIEAEGITPLPESNNTEEEIEEISIAIEPPVFSPLIREVIDTAMSFFGTRYKYGGTTKRGMDCSGLIYTSFSEVDIDLERTSEAMAKQGEEIHLREVQKGDLLFFTTGRSKRINHVGLVVEVTSDEIRFIHSTSSRGVLVSSLREGYWNHAFHHARRII